MIKTELKIGRGKCSQERGETKIHTYCSVGSVAWVFVSAQGNWSHKSKSLSEVAAGLLENMKMGAQGRRGRGGRVSVIHTLSLNAISPECQAEMRGGADKKTTCVCVGMCPCPCSRPQDVRHGAQISLCRHDRICSLCNLIILAVR